jgi:hypothetical protein
VVGSDDWREDEEEGGIDATVVAAACRIAAGFFLFISPSSVAFSFSFLFDPTLVRVRLITGCW